MATTRLFYFMQLTERARRLLGYKLLMAAALLRISEQYMYTQL